MAVRQRPVNDVDSPPPTANISNVLRVVLVPEAQREFDELPSTVKPRVLAVFRRLANWPTVSGVKWLRGEWAGYARVRVGDWRVLFAFVQPDLVVVRIRHRREVYED